MLIISLILVFNAVAAAAAAAYALNPILNSKNPSAVPVQNFDFVYIPRNVVNSHLPAFSPKQLKLKAEKIAKEFKVENKIPLNCMRNQVQLVDWYNKHQIFRKDPQGVKRKALKMELSKLNAELSILIPSRRNFISDLERIQQSIRVICVPPNINARLNDLQFKECMAMKQQELLLSNELMKLNLKERQILKRERDLRKKMVAF